MSSPPKTRNLGILVGLFGALIAVWVGVALTLAG